MSVLDLGPNEAFTIRIYKRLASNPALFWANAYECHAPDAAPTAAALQLVSALVSFEKALHLDDVQFDRAVFSTYAQDGEPYDPESFITYPLTGTGEVAAVGVDRLSLNHCLFIRRIVQSGRTGKLFYRRCLIETDVSSPAGTVALEGSSTVFGRVTDAIADSGLDSYLAGEKDLWLAMIANAQPLRYITGFQVAGARIMQYNNRYFDVP